MPKTFSSSELTFETPIVLIEGSLEGFTNEDTSKISDIFQGVAIFDDTGAKFLLEQAEELSSELCEEPIVEFEELFDEISLETPATDGAADGESDDQGSSEERIHEDLE